MSLFQAVTGNVIDGIRCTLVVATLVSAISFYVSARDVASPVAAAIGAAFYTLLPYHLVDVYERFGFTEYLAFAFSPILFRAARRLGDGPSWGAWLALTGAYAGLVLTHVITAYAVLLVFVPYVLVIARRTRSWWPVRRAASAGVVALLLCGAYLLPALVEHGETSFSYYYTANASWRAAFFFRESTAYGGPIDPAKPLIMMASFAMLAVVGITAWFARSRTETRPYVALAAWAFFLELPVSTPLWAALPGLGLGTSAIVTNAQPYRFDMATAMVDENHWHFIVEHMPAGTNFADPWTHMQWEQPEAFLGGPGTFETLAWTAATRRVRVTMPEGGPVVLRTFAMSGWETRLDGNPVAHHPDAKYLAIEVDVPPGTHEIEAVYGTTWDRRAGAVVSAATLAILLGVAAAVVRRRRSFGSEGS